MIEHRGDIHHIFPKDYLKKAGLTRGKYNQIANYVYMQSEINVKVGNKAPNVYMAKVREQVENGSNHYSGISDRSTLHKNLQENAVPLNIFDLDVSNYEDFLQERRKLMAGKIRGYYGGL